METPESLDMDQIPSIPLCVHEINTRITVGEGEDGSLTRLVIKGHDENDTDMIVVAHLPGCMLDQLSVRLQEYQMAATMEGIHKRMSPGAFAQLRSMVLDRFTGRKVNSHGH